MLENHAGWSKRPAQARIGGGRLALRPAPGDLAALVREAVAGFAERPGLAERGLRVVARVHDAPLAGHFDAVRLGQVLHNLLENARKYSPAGGEVAVEARRVGAEAHLAVRDRGIGVVPGERERLFLPFYRADNASAGSPEGLGLGLYISRGIVEGHGGRLWAEGADGGGSVFRLVLPLGAAARAAMARAGAVPPPRALSAPSAPDGGPGATLGP